MDWDISILYVPHESSLLISSPKSGLYPVLQPQTTTTSEKIHSLLTLRERSLTATGVSQHEKRPNPSQPRVVVGEIMLLLKSLSIGSALQLFFFLILQSQLDSSLAFAPSLRSQQSITHWNRIPGGRSSAVTPTSIMTPLPNAAPGPSPVTVVTMMVESDDDDSSSARVEPGTHEELMYALGVNLARQLGDIRPLVNDGEELAQVAKGLLDTIVGRLSDDGQRALLMSRGKELDDLVVSRA